MRADRLLSLLMLLQARGRMTARALARELEVSERTIYRDIEALGAAGVPVYADRGPGGGCALLDSYRTTLTGLTDDELRALFMVSVPSPLAELGLSDELRGAMRKLAAALPASRRQEEDRLGRRVYLDWDQWFHSVAPAPHLPALQRAVWGDLRLRLVYRLPFGERACWLVEPYGLVAKAGEWYVVAARGGYVRAYQLARVIEVQLTDERFVRAPEFDLAAFWEAWRAAEEARRPQYLVEVTVAPDLAWQLPRYFGEPARGSIVATGAPDATGWRRVTLVFDSLESARERILGFGRAIEVLAPEPLRLSVADFAAQVAALYRQSESPA